MAFVAPQRPSIQIGDVSFNPFCDALELYARTRGKEKRDEESYGMLLRMAAEAGVNLPEETESETDAPPDVMCHGNSCPVEQPENASEPDKAATLNLDGFEPVPLRAHNTHTHTQPGPMTAEADSPSPSPAKDRAKSARSSNTCSASSTPTAAHAAGSPRKPTAR